MTVSAFFKNQKVSIYAAFQQRLGFPSPPRMLFKKSRLIQSAFLFFVATPYVTIPVASPDLLLTMRGRSKDKQ
jgi:hypothetical protein